MPTFGEAIRESTRLALCAVFAANESVNALLSPVFGDSFGLYPASSGLRRKLCSDNPDNDPTYVPPFEGGQCVEKYIVDYEFDESGSTGGSVLVIGPIRGIVEIDGGFGSKQVFLQANSGAVFGGQCFNILNPSGAQNVFLGSYTPPPGGGGTSRILGLTPCGADNCGDTPPPPAEPAPVEFNTDVTYNIDGDTTITVPVGFIFSPFYINPNFDISGTVEFTVDGIEFKGEVTVSPEFNFEFNPKGIKPGPGVPDDDDDGGGGGGEGTPVPEDGDDFDAIIGVLVFSVVVSENRATVLDSTDGPNIYAPRIGSVQFAIKTGNSIGWTADQDVKNLESYIPCPVPQGAIAVRVTPAPGITRTFTPVRGRPLTQA